MDYGLNGMKMDRRNRNRLSRMGKKSGHFGGAFSMAELTRMEKNGLWTEWHENGQKSYEATYKNGKLIK